MLADFHSEVGAPRAIDLAIWRTMLPGSHPGRGFRVLTVEALQGGRCYIEGLRNHQH